MKIEIKVVFFLDSKIVCSVVDFSKQQQINVMN